MWVPTLLAYYPSIWSYDVNLQIPHFMHRNITSWQPILHTVFLETFLLIGKKIKNYEFGMLLLSLIQMITMSGIFSYSIEKITTKIKNKKVVKIFRILMIVYFGLVPFNPIMSISMTKDVLFSGFLLLNIIFMYELIDKRELTLKQKIFFIINASLLMLIKNNGLIIFTFFTISSILLLKKDIKKTFIKISSISIFCYYFLNLLLVLVLRPEREYKFEKYSVQTQNLIYIVIKHPELDVDTNDKLFDFIDRSCFNKNLNKKFNKNNADYAKFGFLNCLNNNFNEHQFISIWVRYGTKYPLDYIDSWSNLTIGSWYLLDESHANVYTKEKKGYLITNFNPILLKKPKSKFKWLYDKLELIATNNIQYKNINPLRFIFEPATYIFSFILLFILSLKKKEELCNYLFLIALYISILNGPVIIVRYIYPFMISVPIFFIRKFSLKEVEQ